MIVHIQMEALLKERGEEQLRIWNAVASKGGGRFDSTVFKILPATRMINGIRDKEFGDRLMRQANQEYADYGQIHDMKIAAYLINNPTELSTNVKYLLDI